MNEMRYKYGDDEITIWEDGLGAIHVYEDNESTEVEFFPAEANLALEVLENIYHFLLNHPTYNYIDISSYEGEDEDGDLTGDWHWIDSIMNDVEINPHFLPEDGFAGNCLYTESLPYIIEAIREYLNPKDMSNIDNLTLRSVLKLKRNLTNNDN